MEPSVDKWAVKFVAILLCRWKLEKHFDPPQKGYSSHSSHFEWNSKRWIVWGEGHKWHQMTKWNELKEIRWTGEASPANFGCEGLVFHKSCPVSLSLLGGDSVLQVIAIHRWCVMKVSWGVKRRYLTGEDTKQKIRQPIPPGRKLCLGFADWWCHHWIFMLFNLGRLFLCLGRWS